MNVLRFVVILAVVFTLLFVVNAFVFAQGPDEFPLDESLLPTGLQILAFLGGAPALAYYVMKYVGPELAKSGWNDFSIRISSLVFTACIAWVAWFALLALTSGAWPGVWQDWLNRMFAIAVTSWSANQVIHGWGQKRSEHGGLT